MRGRRIAGGGGSGAAGRRRRCPVRRSPPTPDSGPPDDEKVTFTVGLTQDVDSLNPFTGIVSSAYEIYQLQYETLTDYGVKDFSAQPAAGRELGRVRRRAHLDLPPARRR